MKGILFDFEKGNVCVKNGSLAVGDVEEQIVQTALTAFKGEFKEVPAIGGEIKKLQGGCVDVMWPGKMKRMLRACGVEVNRVVVEGGLITIE